MREAKIQAQWIALLAATAIALYLCWLMLRPFVEVLEWAAVLVILFYPAHKRIAARLRRPWLSALVSSLLVVAIVFIPLTLIALALVNELSGMAQSLPANISAFLDPHSTVMGRLLGWLGQYVDMEKLRSQQFLADWLKGASGAVASHTLSFVGGAVGAIVESFFVIFTMYYLFRDGDKIMRALPAALPLERKDSEAIFARAREVVGASVYGVITIALIQGTLGGLAFRALSLPSSIVWAVVMAVLSMIPMAGAYLVWVPAAIFLAATGHWVKALMLAAWGLLVVGTVDNFLRPKLVGSQAKLHELFIFFSVIGGLRVFGVLGVVLGPVVLAITLSLLSVFRHMDHRSEGPGRESAH
ncbi:MAG: AI-2E family transporter [Pyrinomonadaceae bacterium]